MIGSNNKGKVREIRQLLPKRIKIYSTNTYKIKAPKENGKTFLKNSLIKARYYSKKTGKICIADDSGLEIDILKKAPGIYSARWTRKNNNFNLAISKIYKEMRDKSKSWEKNSKAKFICCLTLFWPSGKFYSSIGKVKGKISAKKKGKKGFGYDPIFVPKNYSKTFGEMNFIKKKSIDHRYKAFLKIKKYFY